MAKRGHILGCSIALALAALSYVLSISPLWLEVVLYYGFGGLLILPGSLTCLITMPVGLASVRTALRLGSGRR